MNLYEQIQAAGTQRTTKAEIVQYYQQENTGKGAKGWKQTLLRDMLDRLHDVTPSTVGADEYKRMAKNLAKRFDPKRLDNPEPRNAAEYEKLGETLPVMPPKNGYKISGVFFVRFSDGACEDRLIDPPLYITGDNAKTLSEASNRDALLMIVNGYMEEPLDTKEGDGVDFIIGDCNPPVFTVEAIG